MKFALGHYVSKHYAVDLAIHWANKIGDFI